MSIMFLTEFRKTESTEHCELVQHTTKTKERYVHFKVTTSLKDKQTQERKDGPFLPRRG